MLRLGDKPFWPLLCMLDSQRWIDSRTPHTVYWVQLSVAAVHTAALLKIFGARGWVAVGKLASLTTRSTFGVGAFLRAQRISVSWARRARWCVTVWLIRDSHVVMRVVRRSSPCALP